MGLAPHPEDIIGKGLIYNIKHSFGQVPLGTQMSGSLGLDNEPLDEIKERKKSALREKDAREKFLNAYLGESDTIEVEFPPQQSVDFTLLGSVKDLVRRILGFENPGVVDALLEQESPSTDTDHLLAINKESNFLPRPGDDEAESDDDFFAHMENPLDPKAQKAVEREVKKDVKRDWFLAKLDPDKVVEELSDEEWLERFNPDKVVEEYHAEKRKGKIDGDR